MVIVRVHFPMRTPGTTRLPSGVNDTAGAAKRRTVKESRTAVLMITPPRGDLRITTGG